MVAGAGGACSCLYWLLCNNPSMHAEFSMVTGCIPFELIEGGLHTCQPSLFRWDSPTFTTLVPPSHFYPLLSHFHKSTSINHKVAKKDDSEKREYNFKSINYSA